MTVEYPYSAHLHALYPQCMQHVTVAYSGIICTHSYTHIQQNIILYEAHAQGIHTCAAYLYYSCTDYILYTLNLTHIRSHFFLFPTGHPYCTATNCRIHSHCNTSTRDTQNHTPSTQTSILSSLSKGQALHKQTTSFL